MGTRVGILGALALFVAAKGLGGSFTFLFPLLGISEWHGPVVGTAFSLLLIAFFAAFAVAKPGTEVPAPMSAGARRVFLGLCLVVILSAIAVRVRAVRSRPIDAYQADMLPTVQALLRDVTEGRHPYRPHLLPNGKVIPHIYLPALWLPYLPFHALGLDLRYWNILAHLVFYLLLVDCFLHGERFRFRKFEVAAALFLGTLALHAFSKESIREVTDLHTASFWLFYSVLVWATIRWRPVVLILMAPVVMLCREPAILLLLPLLAYWWRAQRALFYRGVWVSLAVGLSICAPFLLMAGSDFFGGAKFYSSVTAAVTTDQMLRQFGLSGALKALGCLWLQTPIQALGALVPIVLSIIAPVSGSAGALALGGISYTTFMLFISLAAPYTYAEPLLLAYFLFVSGVPAAEITETRR